MTQEQFNEMMEVYLSERNKKGVSKWAEKDFEQAVKDGITTGEKPQGFATREETPIMVLRATNKE